MILNLIRHRPLSRARNLQPVHTPAHTKVIVLGPDHRLGHLHSLQQNHQNLHKGIRRRRRVNRLRAQNQHAHIRSGGRDEICERRRPRAGEEGQGDLVGGEGLGEGGEDFGGEFEVAFSWVDERWVGGCGPG
jgi:hypothetical protein